MSIESEGQLSDVNLPKVQPVLVSQVYAVYVGWSWEFLIWSSMIEQQTAHASHLIAFGDRSS
jgi:hypothetical protein